MAFGAGAAGRIDNLTYIHTADTVSFESGVNTSTWGDPVLLEIDRMFLELRKIYSLSEGMEIKMDDYKPLAGHFDDITEDLTNKGLLQPKGDSIRLTEIGRFWAGNMSALFSDRINKVITGG